MRLFAIVVCSSLTSQQSATLASTTISLNVAVFPDKFDGIAARTRRRLALEAQRPCQTLLRRIGRRSLDHVAELLCQRAAVSIGALTVRCDHVLGNIADQNLRHELGLRRV